MNFKAVSMNDKRFDKICDMIHDSYPNSCVLYIDEVFNEPLQNAYNKRRESMQMARGAGAVRELQLFHGTIDTNINQIAIILMITKNYKSIANDNAFVILMLNN